MTINYIYGYARVSTTQQDLIRQLDLIKEYNCQEILTEKMSGVKADRPELIRLRDKVRPGDTLVIESFSRLGRSTKDLIELVEYFENKGVKLISIKEQFDTYTPHGKLMLTVFQAFSQFERDLIVQRTKEGLISARARGRKGGRPKVKDKNIEKALKLYHSKEYSISEIVEMSGVSQATLYRYLEKIKSTTDNMATSKVDKIAEIHMSLMIENNNKFVRGKKKTRENIERYLKSYYTMNKLDQQQNDYLLFVKYVTIDNLDNTVHEILRDLENEADLNNCFIEADVRCEKLELNW
ncbi:recombinase family protein [Bacillaceae bacterium IKA-2]|nr:recombinase family protein [Bacillaceae bacterium IKA-2]